MFTEFADACAEMTDAELDERLRANELETRRLASERSALLAVTEHRGSFRADGHRSMTAYLRATTNTSSATAGRDLKLARLLDTHPTIGDAVAAGRVSVDHALEIARIHTNPRIASLPTVVVDVLVDDAEHRSHRELRTEIDRLVALLDHDGAFDDLTDTIEGRRASVVEAGGSLHVSSNGGDPVLAARIVSVFESFVDAEYRADIAARRQQYGDDADQHPFPRTPTQRRFDALITIFAAAAASPEGRALPDTVVDVIVSHDQLHDTLTHAGITLPDGTTLDLDEHGDFNSPSTLRDLAGELADDPETFRRRRCETSTGTPIHPTVLLRSLLTSHVRRVVVDSQSLVIDYGTKRRLFTGAARHAALLLATTCEHPGCEHPGRWSQIDHNHEWSTGGPTDQSNAAIECGHHNRHKHRTRTRTRRDHRGRAYTIRADGTIILPAGEHPPDLTPDQQRHHARTRLHDLITERHGYA